MRPQATLFADSARCRESVMSLGTITHIQHFFARTGLLDGKGGQFLKTKDAETLTEAENGQAFDLKSQALYGENDGMFNRRETEEDDEATREGQNSALLPPTVSTYNYRLPNARPLPAPKVLREKLKDNLENSRKLVTEITNLRFQTEPQIDSQTTADEPTEQKDSGVGWLEIQGLRLLDVFTLTISAAKSYYTAHENPQRLYSLKPERELRRELYQVLEILRSITIRNFSGGVRSYEAERLMSWLTNVDRILNMEESLEEADRRQRESWKWRSGDWTERVRERERLFLSSFDPESPPLPTWPENNTEGQYPNEFLKVLQNGLRLVILHNRFVRLSRRQFELIKYYHTDVAKPYRSADNLRYWVKAAQLRWDIKLDINVMAIVRGSDLEAWKEFDNAVLKWSQRVREEIVSEWAEDE